MCRSWTTDYNENDSQGRKLPSDIVLANITSTFINEISLSIPHVSDFNHSFIQLIDIYWLMEEYKVEKNGQCPNEEMKASYWMQNDNDRS